MCKYQDIIPLISKFTPFFVVLYFTPYFCFFHQNFICKIRYMHVSYTLCLIELYQAFSAWYILYQTLMLWVPGIYAVPDTVLGLHQCNLDLFLFCIYRYEQLIDHTKGLSGRTYKLVNQLLEHVQAQTARWFRLLLF